MVELPLHEIHLLPQRQVLLQHPVPLGLLVHLLLLSVDLLSQGAHVLLRLCLVALVPEECAVAFELRST